MKHRRIRFGWLLGAGAVATLLFGIGIQKENPGASTIRDEAALRAFLQAPTEEELREVVLPFHMDPRFFADMSCMAEVCHGNRYDERAPLDDTVFTGHSTMLRGLYPPPSGESQITADTCRQCHKSVDCIDGSAAHLRKQVSLERPTMQGLSCVGCHSGFFLAIMSRAIWTVF